jgi:excisionase family DNA binding protein
LSIHPGPLVTIERDVCVPLGRHLVEAIRLYLARGIPPPKLLIDHADEVNQAARSFAGFREEPQVSPARETVEASQGAILPGLPQPDWLTASEAARLAGCSVQWMRKCLRGGDLTGSRGAGSAWRIDPAELDAWLVGRRRKENEQKAA